VVPELAARLPAIMAEAAKSALGILALMFISLAIFGFLYKGTTEKTRIAIFVLLFVGVVAFGLSVVRTSSVAARAERVVEAPPGHAAAEAHPERIGVTLRRDNGDPTVRVQAARVESAQP
jgi:membrane-bound ClpP family serine protease